MNRALLSLLVVLSCPAHAAEEEPTRLTSLRESWKLAKDRSVRPTKEKYLTALIKLRTELTRQKNLQAAILVRNEIEALTGGALQEGAASGEPARLKNLRAVFHRETQRLDDANNRKYESALNNLQNSYSKRGELENALAVANELKLLAQLQDPMIGTWQLVSPNGKVRPGPYMEVHRDGRFEVLAEREWSGRYEFLNPQRTSMKRTCNNGREFMIRYDAGTSTLVQDDKASYRRFKAE